MQVNWRTLRKRCFCFSNLQGSALAPTLCKEPCIEAITKSLFSLWQMAGHEMSTKQKHKFQVENEHLFNLRPKQKGETQLIKW
jgi:hypothetical protein